MVDVLREINGSLLVDVDEILLFVLVIRFDLDEDVLGGDKMGTEDDLLLRNLES